MTESSPGKTDARPDPVILKITIGTLTRAVGLIRSALGWLTLIYGGGLLVGMAALEWWGERFWVLSVLLYAPPQILLLPLALLTPLCLLFRARLCLWHLACVLVMAFGFMTFRWAGSSRRDDKMITAVTFNCGESYRPQMAAFIEQEKPDFILLQDAGYRGPELAAKLPGSFVAGHREFVLVSRYPVIKSGLVAEPNWEGRPVAARFEVMVKDQPLVLYSVHLPTPRHELSRFIGGRRILGDLVGRKQREPGFGNYREWLDKRIQLASALAKVFKDEKQPFIVGGDFNTPDHGYIYHLFAAEMTDAFTVAGRGWGLTFPGHTRNPLTAFGPWLRLDYFFTGRGWRAVECRPEPGDRSQHKAVLARFEPLPRK
jgi:vancomycin resistance protein VanJ